MIYSKTCEYAVRALSYLATKPLDALTKIPEVYEKTGLPGPYISKIFRSLTHAGILKSARGAAGGFSFTRHPHEISVFDVMNAVDSELPWKGCAMGLNECRDDNACPAHEIWKVMVDKITEKFKQTKLSAIKKKVGKYRFRDLQRARLNDLMKV